MIIDLKTITSSGKSFIFSLEEEWWKSKNSDDQIISLNKPLSVEVDISRAGKRFILEGQFFGEVQVKCDRCLSVYHKELEHDFKLFLESPSSNKDKMEVELQEEDMEVGFIDGMTIDLNEIIQEQIYLTLPLKTLCKEDCMGLCPGCGMNLNKNNCECEKKQGHPVFSKLKNIKI